MSASNYNWVCFDCRFATRRAKTASGSPKCAVCGRDCFCLGYKVEVLRKGDARGWNLLLESCRARAAKVREEAARDKVRRKHDIEKEIVRLESLGPNKGRSQEIKRLRQILEEEN